MSWISINLLKRLINPKIGIFFVLIITHFGTFLLGKNIALKKARIQAQQELINHYEHWQMAEPKYEEEIQTTIKNRVINGPNDKRDSKLLSTRPFKN